MYNIKKYGLLSVITLLVIAGLCMSYSLDMQFALLPFDYSSYKFYGESALWCRFLYNSITYITIALIAVPIIMVLIKLYYKKLTFGMIVFTVIYYLSFTAGPGVLVNAIFKNYWGRARPTQVIKDGAKYSDFWQYNSDNSENNSFPSGHASVGFFVGVPLLIARKRNYGLLLSIGFGGLIGLVRILQGGHFFSDVLMAFVVVWGAAELINYGVRRYVRE